MADEIVARNREIIAELQTLWSGTPRDEFKRLKVSTGRMVFALTANAYAKSRALDVLWNHGMWSESTPIVRNCFESALYAAWIQQVGRPGVPNVLAKMAQSSDNLREELVKAGVSVPADLGAVVRAQRQRHDDVRQSRLHLPAVKQRDAEVAKVEQLCARLGGSALYLMYRHLSAGSHAFGPMSLHVQPGDTGDVEHLLRPAAGDRDAAALSAYVAYSLTWATRAWSELNVGKPAKKVLQTAGRRLGVPSLLTYTAPAASAWPRRRTSTVRATP